MNITYIRCEIKRVKTKRKNLTDMKTVRYINLLIQIQDGTRIILRY